MKKTLSAAYLPRHRLDRLPFTCPPMPDETTGSYIYRLARHNDVDPDLLGEIAADDNGDITAPRLAEISGQPVRSLKHAMLQLCTPSEWASMPVAGRPHPGANRRVMCTRCARSRGATITPVCSTRHEDIICLRHQRWIGRRDEEGPQLNLSAQPEIPAANRRHRLMIRRLGREPVRLAFGEPPRSATTGSRTNTATGTATMRFAAYASSTGRIAGSASSTAPSLRPSTRKWSP